MAQVGIVKTLEGGVFYAKDSSGNIRELSIGDSISENEVVYSDSSNQTSAKVEMELSGNDIIVLNQAQQQLIDSSLNQVTFGNEEVIFSKGDINTAFENADLSAWNNTTDDVSDDMETAAGDPTQQETQAGEEEPTEEGRVTARFSARDGSSTDVRSDLRDTIDFGTQLSEGDNDDEIAAELLNPQTTTTTPTTPTIPVDTRVEASKITLSNPTVDEGKDITITATVDNAPQTDLVITLNNGEKITIKAGETSGSTTFTNPNTEDVYKDSSTETYTIVGTDGGNYKDLDIADKSTVTIVDTIDATNYTLTSIASGDEENASITYTVTFDNPTTAAETVSFKVGNETITIDVPANSTGASKEVSYKDAVKDYYEDVTNVPAPTDLSSTNNSKFEGLNPVNNATAKSFEDHNDATNYTLTSIASGDEENASITYTVTFDNPTTAAETVSFKVGNETITIDVPANSTGASKEVSYKDAVKDYYEDVTNVPAPTDLSSTNNSKFEGLNPVNNATAKSFEDHNDATTVTITAAKVTDKVITKDNFENNQGFTVKAKDPYGNDAKISTHTGPAGFGVESLAETNSGKLGQTDQVYSGHTSEIGVVKDGSTYKSESIEVEFKNPVHTLDVAFAWRHNGETAKVDFYNGNEKVGYAIVSGGGSNTDAIIRYYDKNGNLKDTVNAQGGTDNVDLVYTFKPAGDVTFTKAVFSADGAGSDYLIHSISYKEVSEGDSTTIVGSDEVAFKISTSNIPDSSKYDFINTFPTADVKIVDKNSGEVLFEKTVNLDKDGKAIVTVRTDGTKDLKAEVSNVQGNFEEVDYTNAKTEVEASIKATASNDSFNTFEDTNYVLKTTDFGDNNQNVAKIKFYSVPVNGTIYVLKSEYTGSMNDRAEYTSSENKVYIEVKAGDIVDISKIENGNVVFVPENNTDSDSSFKFSVSNGNGNFSGNYTTDIIVKAVADAPALSIDITKIGATIIVVDGDTGNSNNDGNNSIGGIVTENFWKGYSTKEDIMTNSTHNENSIGWQNPFTQNSDNVDINGDQTQWIDTQDGNDNVYISGNASGMNTGNGDDKVFIKGDATNNINLGSGNDELHIKGNSSTIDAGDGDDKLKIEGNANNDIQLGAGNDSLEIKGNSSSISAGDGDDKIKIEGNSNGTIELGNGNNYLEIKGDASSIQVSQNSGNDRVIVNGNATNNISLGKGDDYLELDGKIQNYVDGGEGNNDSVYLKGYTLTEYQALIANGNEWRVQNFENIKLGDGTIVKGDGSVFETSKPENIIKAVEYKVDISAALTDTDGSETLSVVIKNVPTGAVLESTKYDVSKNSDGSWSVNFKAGTTGDALLKIEDSLTMKVPQSYKGEINLQIEAKATEKNDNLDGNNFATAKDDASVVTVTIESFNAELDMDISEATIKVIETKDVNTLATTSAGIYEKDGKYYKTEVQSHTEKVLDTEALKNLQVTINGKTYTGITVGADGKYYVIDNTIAKEQKTIEVEREVTKTIELDDKSIDAFMIQVTKETKGIVLGKEVTNLGAGDTISNTKSKIYTLEQPTSNIEIKFTSGSAKLEFVDANGKVIGSSTTQTGTDSKGYNVPKDAVGVKITSTSTSTSLKIDAIKYHVDPHEETVQVGGKILDVESMQKAGITWNSTISEKQVQTITNEDLKKNIDYDLVKLGSEVGDGNIKGFNPEAKANSQVFDFGKDKAYQLVTIKVDATISGSWNFNKDSTKDVFVVNANGVPQGAYNYTSSQDYNNITPSQTTLNRDIATAKTNGYDLSYVNGTLNKTYEYKVYLDENGQVQMNFVVASTNTDEFVTVNNISVSYAGLSGFVQTKTEIEKVTETIFVGVPTNVEYKGELPTKEITKYETVQVETTPIYTKLTQYEYKLDLSAAISEGKGELSEFTLKHIPNGVSIKGYESNEDGSYTIKIGEDGKAQVTLISDSLLSSDEKEGITANISASSEDDNQTSDIEVNIDGEISHSSNVTGTEDNNDISINTDNLTSINIDGGDGYDTIKLEENSNIDFSKLENLSIKNIEAIDLTEGNHKLQNLTLDDVLKLSGDDNTIKITGDEFDSVTFKNTVGDDGKENAWSKTEGTGADKGYDIYMNSGDPTVQVKVEQPISDGITN